MIMVQGSFLNAEQKAIKHDIMLDLFKVLTKHMQNNVTKLDNQSSTDIIFSCLIMFGREIVVDMIMSTGDPEKHAESVLKSFCATMTHAVLKGIEDVMTNETGEVH